jgi:ABC-type glycerol-3-phosphate transport system substrate-binding protein
VKRTALLAALALGLAACHAVRYDAGRPPSQRRYEKTVHFWLWGLAGHPRVDLDAACPEGVARFRNEAGPLHWVAEVATVGLWSPRRVVVECAEVAR